MTTDASAPNRHEGPADPDDDIIDHVRRGERHTALRKLMQRYGGAVYRFCREQLRDDARAADVQQNVFIAAYHALPNFAQRSLIRNWLFAIARNRVLDNVKGHTRHHSHYTYDDGADIAAPEASPAERLDDARLREALTTCVGELSPEIREAVLLRFQQGFTFEEMADICDEKAGTLQARVARAMGKLRACITARTGGAP